MVHYIDLSWNTLGSSLILMHKKLNELDWNYYNGDVHVVELETQTSQQRVYLLNSEFGKVILSVLLGGRLIG